MGDLAQDLLSASLRARLARAGSVVLLVGAGCAPHDAAPRVASPSERPIPHAATERAAPHATSTAPPGAGSSCQGDPHAGIVWRSDRELSTFWAIDQASRWNDSIGDTYPDFFAQGLPAAPGDTEALAAYARLRKKYSRETSSPDPDPAHPLDMLPPRMLAMDRYAEAFLCAKDPKTAGSALGMSDDEQATLEATFARFRPRLEAAYARAGYVEAAVKDLRALADRSHMVEFLGAMRRFYGSEALPDPLYVDILFTPPSRRHQATAIGAHMVIPLAETAAKDPKELAGWLGVVVHEFGHQFLAYVSDARRAELSTTIVGHGGLLQRRHPNVVDESLQSAFGNLLFLRDHLPEGLDESNVYGLEPELEYPDLIDSLARKVEPLVKDALAHGRVLDDAFIDAILAAQAKVAPPEIAHFSRVALVYAPKKRDRLDFEGMFWGRSRFVSESAHDFAETSRLAPKVARWVVVTTSDLDAERDAVVATMPDTARAVADLRGGYGGCARASLRPSGTWDVAVVGADAAGLRRVLIALERGAAPAAVRPLCVK